MSVQKTNCIVIIIIVIIIIVVNFDVSAGKHKVS